MCFIFFFLLERGETRFIDRSCSFHVSLWSERVFVRYLRERFTLSSWGVYVWSRHLEGTWAAAPQNASLKWSHQRLSCTVCKSRERSSIHRPGKRDLANRSAARAPTDTPELKRRRAKAGPAHDARLYACAHPRRHMSHLKCVWAPKISLLVTHLVCGCGRHTEHRGQTYAK